MLAGSFGLIILGFLLHVTNFGSWWRAFRAAPMAVIKSPITFYKKLIVGRNWLLNKFEYLLDETNDDGSVNHLPPHIDVRTGTVCNFKCIHCGPGASSRWMEDYDLIIGSRFKNNNPFDAFLSSSDLVPKNQS